MKTLTIARTAILFGSGLLVPSACSRSDGASSAAAPLGKSVPGEPVGAAGSAGASGSSDVGKCPKGLPGPALALLQSPSGVSYCMDRTEVTQGQYTDFMKALDGKVENAAPLADQHPICKIGFDLLTLGVEATEDTPGRCAPSLYDPERKRDVPVVCVSHCAARLYCAWAGKVLCGRPEGGRGTLDDYDSLERSAWYNACTSGGQYSSAAPGAVDSGACSLLKKYGTGAKAVDADPACHSPRAPFDAVLNLGGSVREWEDACDASGCLIRGPAQAVPGERTRDDCTDRGSRGGPADDVGFRCCVPMPGN